MHPRQYPAPSSAKPLTRVGWWAALALPVAAFVTLLALAACPARATERPDRGQHPVMEQVQRVLPDVVLDFLVH
ncbi:hypothetical protein AQ490_03770 [Wenjunlia vitaminophila]|uniref:Uncharacterized protein n=1 Tax=Wenjunlia vitaminophila TaxID=76728 RepID=A0A0T6LT33_WENVI|nr:hypothetical protein [Wenjunlia vitaminophila]KRV49319.1 hypothetical protein AQ490_03770 [Wenjunlia vitaminophila]